MSRYLYDAPGIDVTISTQPSPAGNCTVRLRHMASGITADGTSRSRGAAKDAASLALTEKLKDAGIPVPSWPTLWIVVREGSIGRFLSTRGTDPPKAVLDPDFAQWPQEARIVPEEPSVFLAYLDEDEAREQARELKAGLVRLPLTEDYRTGDDAQRDG